MRKAFFPVFAALILTLGITQAGCDPYRKLAKSDKIADKDSAAVKYYNDKKYDRAVYLFEELMPIYAGTSRMEEMYFYYTYCRYYLGELVSAAYYFEDFAKKYPNSKHAQEFEYMTAKCYHLLADPYQLDQKYTLKAIEQYQLFLSRNPYSEHKDKCMAALKELRERLAKKSFEQANLYYEIGYHKAAVVAFENMINEFPDSDLREEAQYLLFKASVKLAQESVQGRKVDRYVEALEYHEKFAEKFPSSKFAKDAEELKAEVEKNRVRLEEEQALDGQRALYNRIKEEMDNVNQTKDDAERDASYAEAQRLYGELKGKYPRSTYLGEADALFDEFESKKDEK